MTKTDVAFAVALCLVVAGVACVYWPAAFIVAGGLLAALAWTLDKSAGNE